jgi:short-subunit dehydrogenase
MANTKRGAGQTALVTGASAGIGVDLAECFAADGYDLIITARTEPALREVADRIAKAHGVKISVVPGDLGAIGGGAKLAADIAQRGLSVDVLVNNAGFGHAGGFAAEPIEPQLGMIDLNDRTLVELTHIYWKGMLAKKRGGVLNVASTAAFQPGPLMAIYYASKAFVLSFSEALWEEARGTGVHVSCLCPGPTASKFRDRAGTDKTRLGKTSKVMPSMPVAKLGYEGFQKNKRVVVTGGRNKLLVGLVKLLPRGQVLKIVRGLQEPA